MDFLGFLDFLDFLIHLTEFFINLIKLFINLIELFVLSEKAGQGAPALAQGHRSVLGRLSDEQEEDAEEGR